MSFIKMQRSYDVDKLLKHPMEFVLLAQIAKRARRSNDDSNIDNLEIGESRIGDYQSIGMSRQQYRRCLTNLQTWHLITIKPTNRGSIATITNTRVFDINIISNQPTNQPETNQPTNQKPTTNNNRKKEKKKDIVPILPDFFDNKEFKKTISAFIQHRKNIKKPMSQHALDLTIKGLIKNSDNNSSTAIEMIENSIARGYQGVFPDKNNKPTQESNIM